ncbi:MAG TPA: VCBS repeat-containing protein [Planctomycetota bacterium]|nr:VCBS repeat-containing protein [Planctomycetota bacterium]
MRFIAMDFSAGALAVLVASPLAAAQLADLQPGRNFTAVSNFGATRSFAVDVADADLDGDLDVITGNGGEGSAQLARIYINDGLAAFTDETATRLAGLPAMNNRDIEFFDADNDGDYDVFASCFTTGGASPGAVSRCFVNLGGAQAGSIGTFAEATDTFWGTLVAVPAVDQLCGGCNSGPFRAFGADADFADLDDDGDLDLFFGIAGPGFSGSRDTRVFLNDGQGTFDELWPWANATADTKLHSVDFELVDYDGDYDFDLLTAGLWSPASTRVFVSNLYDPLGPDPYNDITQHALLDNGAPQIGTVAYEAEAGDVDADGDFDLWMGNYNNNTDRLLRNNGPDAGGFGFSQMNAWIKNDPNSDEEEADFCDYDADGDLDVFTANFSGTNFLYQSGLAQGFDPEAQGLVHRTGVVTGMAPNPELPSNFNGGTSLRGEVADLDGDGDEDFVMTCDANQGNWLFRNVLGVPDPHAPRFAHFTLQPDKPNGTPTVIHAAARDNGPSQLHRYYDAVLVYAVDDGPPQTVPMSNQGGQQYRGVFPAQTNATVAYHVEVTDLNGNTGVSTTRYFDQGDPAVWEDMGSGLAGVSGIPSLVGNGSLTAGSAGTLTLSDAAPSALCALFVSISSAPAPFKCGTLVPVPVALQLTLATNGAGGLPLAWASWPAGLTGASLWFQYAIADGAAVCGTALSNALRADVP